MSTIFTAVQKLKYMQPAPVFVLHSRVVELHPDRRLAAESFNASLGGVNNNGILSKDRKHSYKTYKCLDCGLEWKESIHSPDIVDTATINTYYSQHISCLAVK